MLNRLWTLNSAVTVVYLATFAIVMPVSADDTPTAIDQAKSMSRAFRSAAKTVTPSVVTIIAKQKIRDGDGRRLDLRSLLNDPELRRLFLDGQIPLPVFGADDGLIQLDPPGQREFILDKAGIIQEDDAIVIRKLADTLLTDKAAPIVVATINSMSEHNGQGLRIETFATLLFNQWEIGPAELGRDRWNKGILLLVSKNDRKARIELGAGWGNEKDILCRQIMDQQIIPRFKRGDFSGGILAGAESLEKMARGLELPSAPIPAWFYPVVAITVGLGIFTVVSLIRRRSSGWAWLFWGVVFAVVAAVLFHMVTSGGRSGGGSSGGSFGGGGSSGGGGASGSW